MKIPVSNFDMIVDRFYSDNPIYGNSDKMAFKRILPKMWQHSDNSKRLLAIVANSNIDTSQRLLLMFEHFTDWYYDNSFELNLDLI